MGSMYTLAHCCGLHFQRLVAVDKIGPMQESMVISPGYHKNSPKGAVTGFVHFDCHSTLVFFKKTVTSAHDLPDILNDLIFLIVC